MKHKYSLRHICTVHCSPIQGRHDYTARKLVRTDKNGRMFHISYDREKDSLKDPQG